MVEDLRHAIRVLRKDFLFSALVILILGLGIGLNTIAFSFLETTVLNPFPYKDSDRIVEVVRVARQRWSGPFNYQAYEALRDSNEALEVFEAVAGYRQRPLTISIDETPESVQGAELTPEVFGLLGVEPILGRAFVPDEQGAGRTSVAIISHHLWESRFGSDPQILGNTIWVDGTDRTIVGVMPRSFTFYQASMVWLPLPVDATTPAEDPYRFAVLGRLRGDVGLPQARAAMATLGETLEPLLGDPLNEYEARRRAAGALKIVTLAEGWNSFGLGAVGALFQVAAGFVLLIVCANLASLLLARGIARRRELAVRRALGAPRRRLVRQILTENMLFAAAGAATGILVAVWGQGLLLAAFPPTPLLDGIEPALDLRILGFAIGLAVIAVFVFGTMPALELSRTDLGAALKQAGFGATESPRARRWQRGLVITQIAFSLILLIGASLTARSRIAIQEVDPGFDAERVFEVWTSFSGLYSDETRDATTRRIIDALERLPGLESVAWTNSASVDVRGNGRGFIELRGGLSELNAFNLGRSVNATYFRTFGLPLVGGRFFSEEDRPGTPRVVVLSEQAARTLWPDDDAIGKEIRFPGGRDWLTVVGVVGNVVRITNYSPDRTERGMFASPWPDIYFAAEQFDAPPRVLVYVRPQVDRATLWQLVRATVAEVDPNVPVTMIRTVQEGVYGPNQLVYGVVGQILSAVGLIAIVLSALGTYSVVCYTWAQRRREVGVRVAFGASANDVFKLVLRDTQKLALMGVLAGTTISLGLYRLAARLFFGVSSWDPIAYGSVALLLFAMAAAAGLNPARIAIRTDPVEVLRQE